jgi:hypothetical protein
MSYVITQYKDIEDNYKVVLETHQFVPAFPIGTQVDITDKRNNTTTVYKIVNYRHSINTHDSSIVHIHVKKVQRG